MEYVIAAVIVGVFIVVILIWTKKTNERQAERMKMLSQEQLDYIKNSGYTPHSENGNLLKTVGVLTNIKEGTSDFVSVDYIFYNCCTQQHELGDGKISRAVIENRSLNVGDYIEIVFKFKNGIIEGFKEIL